MDWTLHYGWMCPDPVGLALVVTAHVTSFLAWAVMKGEYNVGRRRGNWMTVVVDEVLGWMVGWMAFRRPCFGWHRYSWNNIIWVLSKQGTGNAVLTPLGRMACERWPSAALRMQGLLFSFAPFDSFPEDLLLYLAPKQQMGHGRLDAMT